MEESGFSLEEILNQYGSNKSVESYDEAVSEDSEPEYEEVSEPEINIEKSAPYTPVASRREICDWLESMIVAITSVILVMVFIARINQVYGISMLPTLTEGDRLIVTPLYHALNYGDIIIVEAENLPNSKTGEMGEPIVKRVIGLPGDEIFIDSESGEVYRNSERLEETYIAEKIASDKLGNQIYPLVVEEDCVFVMGDNRNHSTDSRFTSGGGVLYYVGCVKTGHIIGKAVFRVYPFEGFGGL